MELARRKNSGRTTVFRVFFSLKAICKQTYYPYNHGNLASPLQEKDHGKSFKLLPIICTFYNDASFESLKYD